jgi:hypothetical protein
MRKTLTYLHQTTVKTYLQAYGHCLSGQTLENEVQHQRNRRLGQERGGMNINIFLNDDARKITFV